MAARASAAAECNICGFCGHVEWDLAVHPNGPSTVVGGPHDGATLAEIVDDAPEAFGDPIDLGAMRLDCAENLSVQVHPTEDDPKTEAWVFLEAKPNAGVFHGFRRHLDRAEVKSAALGGAPRLALAGLSP